MDTCVILVSSTVRGDHILHLSWKSVFKNPDVAETLSTIHEKNVVVPADKAS
jgi:hypothetical protein